MSKSTRPSARVHQPRPAELVSLADSLQRIVDLLSGLESAIRECRQLVNKSESIKDATAAVDNLLRSIPSPDDRDYPTRPFEVWLIPDDSSQPTERINRYESAEEANNKVRRWNRESRESTECTAVVRVAEWGVL